MKAFLMYRNRDFDLEAELPVNQRSLIQDLELNTLFNAMSLGDEFLFEVAKKAVLTGLKDDTDTILYRQSVLKDCLKNSSTVINIYNTVFEAIENERKNFWGIFATKSPESILNRSVTVLEMFLAAIKTLKNIAGDCSEKFDSEGFSALFCMLKKEFCDEYFNSIQDHLRELNFKNGILLSAELGRGNTGVNYVLRKSNIKKQKFFERIFAKGPQTITHYVHERDECGHRMLAEIKDRGLNLVANALAQSTDHILGFLKMLRIELAFYIGCLNLHKQLISMDAPVSFPNPQPCSSRSHQFSGLYDISLALTKKQKVVGNDISAQNKLFVIITGANQGGKSTFLRSIGQSQLMMQCGMFVPAQHFSSNLCDNLFTHFKREEDTDMKSGKFDEELARMDDIVNNITSGTMILFNESFAATNEREGSEIARQITSALYEKNIKVFFVTHLFEFANGLSGKMMENALFLRAQRQDNGERTFRLIEGEPLQTSFGEDLYKKIFNESGNT